MERVSQVLLSGLVCFGLSGCWSIATKTITTTYAVTVTGDAHLAIDPASTQDVLVGTTRTLSVTPSTGYSPSPVVGGSCPTGSWSGLRYTTGSIAGNCSVIFRSTANAYVLTYEGNANTAGSPPTDSGSPYAYGSAVTVLADSSLALTGYAFAGWNTAADGSGTAYAPGAIFSMPAAAVTLYAQWAIQSYSLTYSGNGSSSGTVPVDNHSPYPYGGNVSVLGNTGSLAKTGYAFAGWNTAADGSGTAYAAGAPLSMPAAAVTLYAQWAIQSYSVSYNGNGSTSGTAPADAHSPYPYNSTVTVLANSNLAKTGYAFLNWNSAADGSGSIYEPGATFSMPAGNITLYAQWTVHAYNVTYQGNGNTSGTAPTDPDSPYNPISSVTVLGNTGNLARTGYFFSGWYAAGTVYTPGATFYMATADVTLYAQWALPGQWAKSIGAGSGASQFNSVAVDSDGNTYAAGYIGGAGTYTFATGVTATGTSSGSNAVLVKYNSSGVAQWAQTVSLGGIDSWFTSVAVDGSGNLYAAGYINGVGPIAFGNGISIKGSSAYYNVLLVKYNSSGTAQWAQSVSTGDNNSLFSAVATDSSGNIYAGGWIGDSSTYTFGTGVSASGSYTGGSNFVLVKYNAAGAAQWAKTSGTGSFQGASNFTSLAVDGSGNVYAAGSMGQGTYVFDTGVSATGVAPENFVLVQYNASGTAQWARTENSTGWIGGLFESVALDGSGGIYAAGLVYGNGATTFGSGVTVTTPNTFDNAVVVKYDASGTAQWAQAVSTGSDYSDFFSVAVDGGGNVYAAGSINGTGTFSFGPTAGAAGPAANTYNALLLKLDSSGAVQSAQTVSTGAGGSQFQSIAVDGTGHLHAGGWIYGSDTYTFSPGITATGAAASGDNALLVTF
jgi:uncharacterized repeat protein (TIGR02543 family)